MNMNLKADSVSKKYMRDMGEANYIEPVRECSLFLKEGTLTLLRGRSGCGKTTLLNMLAGLLAPTTGKVYLDDTDIYSLDDKHLSALRNRYFGIIPQGESALHSLTLYENVVLPAGMSADRSRYCDNDIIKKRAEMLLEKYGISKQKNARPSEMSGGELRRMAICRALILNPPVIFADEPTGDLDDENTLMVFNSLRELADTGHTVLIVTHEDIGGDYADDVYRMDAGVLEHVFLN